MKRLNPSILAATAILAVAVRVYALGRHPLWYDEVIIANASRRLRIDVIFNVFPFEPVFSGFLRYWQEWGRSEVWMRLPAVLFGLATVCMGCLTGRRLAGERGAIAAAFLLAIAPFLVYYSRDGKMYAWVAFLELCLVYCTLEYAAREGGGRILVVYVVAGAILTHTHRLSPLFFMALNAGYLVCYRNSLSKVSRWFAAQVAVVTLSIPYLAAQWRFVRASDDTIFWALRPVPESLVITAMNLLSGYGLTVWARWTALAVFGLLVLYAIMETSARRPLVFLVAVAVIHVAIYYVVSSSWNKSLYVDRYMIGSSAPLLLVAACGLARLPNAGIRTGVAALLALLFWFPIGDMYAHRFSDDRRQHEGVSKTFDTRGMAQLVNANGREGDVIWHLWWLAYPQLGWYVEGYPHYLVDIGGRIQRDIDLFGKRDEQAAYGMVPLEMETFSGFRGRVWLVEPEPEAFSFPGADPSMLPWLIEHGAVKGVWTFGAPYWKTRVYLFDLTNQTSRLTGSIPQFSTMTERAASKSGGIEAKLERRSGDRVELVLTNTGSLTARIGVRTILAEDVVRAARFRKRFSQASRWRLEPFTSGDETQPVMRVYPDENTTLGDEVYAKTELREGDYRVIVECPSEDAAAPVTLTINSASYPVADGSSSSGGPWVERYAGLFHAPSSGGFDVAMSVWAQRMENREASFSRVYFVSEGFGESSELAPVVETELELAPNDSQVLTIDTPPIVRYVECGLTTEDETLLLWDVVN